MLLCCSNNKKSHINRFLVIQNSLTFLFGSTGFLELFVRSRERRLGIGSLRTSIVLSIFIKKKNNNMQISFRSKTWLTNEKLYVANQLLCCYLGLAECWICRAPVLLEQRKSGKFMAWRNGGCSKAVEDSDTVLYVQYTACPESCTTRYCHSGLFSYVKKYNP